MVPGNRSTTQIIVTMCNELLFPLTCLEDRHEISQSVAIFKVTRIHQEVDKTGIRRSQSAVILLSYEWNHGGDLIQSVWDNLAISCHLDWLSPQMCHRQVIGAYWLQFIAACWQFVHINKLGGNYCLQSVQNGAQLFASHQATCALTLWSNIVAQRIRV